MLPVIRFQQSMNKGFVSMRYPEVTQLPKAPCDTTITLCIDTSGSMRKGHDAVGGSHMQAVALGVQNFIRGLQKFTEKNPHSQVRLSAFSFGEKVESIFEDMKVDPGLRLYELERGFNFTPNGDTLIDECYSKVAKHVLELKEKYPKAIHRVVLLTDGGKMPERASSLELYNALKSVNEVAGSHLLVLGVGQTGQTTLQSIADFKDEDSLNETLPPIGKFMKVDVSDRMKGQAVRLALSRVLQEVTGVGITNLRMNLIGLEENEWCLRDQNSREVTSLPDLQEGDNRNYYIEVKLETIEDTIDLSKLDLEVKGIDPEGKEVVQYFPWRGGAVFDPTIFYPHNGSQRQSA